MPDTMIWIEASVDADRCIVNSLDSCIRKYFTLEEAIESYRIMELGRQHLKKEAIS